MKIYQQDDIFIYLSLSNNNTIPLWQNSKVLLSVHKSG